MKRFLSVGVPASLLGMLFWVPASLAQNPSAAELVPQMPQPPPGDPCAMTQFIVPPGTPLTADAHNDITQGPMTGYKLLDPPRSHDELTDLQTHYRWVTAIHQGHTVPLNDKGQGHDYRSACWNQLLTDIADGF